MRINHNLSALAAQRSMTIVSDRMEKSIERLASGERINKSGDDASGLAVSEKMRTQINGLQMAERNALNGLSFIQVAEGSYQQLTDILQRVRSLAVQSANGIYSNSDRQQIQVEVSQLIDEIDRIATQAEFNRLKMLTGAFSRESSNEMFLHVGPNKDQRIRIYIATVGSKALNLAGPSGKLSISTAGKANAMIGNVDEALNRLIRQRADLGAYYNRLENTMTSLQRGYENMVASDSRIRDADMAEEMVEFTRDKILVQTGTAMLAQANFKPQLVMKLLE